MSKLFLMLMLIVSPLATWADDFQRSVNVSGTSITRVVPDTVHWTISITTTDVDLKIAREASDNRVKGILALRDKLGIDAKDIQTGNLNISKVFKRDSRGNDGEFRHYAFQRTIAICQKNVAKFDDVLQELTGIQDVEISYRLESSQYHDVRNSTRLAALTAAKKKAQEMTELLGAKLGAVLTIQEVENYRLSRNSYSNSAFNADEGNVADVGGGNGTFAPGMIEISVSASVRFAIE